MRRAALTYSAIALATVAVTTGFIARRVLDRPGATAISMVPANASAVVALDLVPAPDQILAFKSIEEMIDKAPGHPPKDALLGGLLQEAFHEEALAPISKQIDRSIALAFLPKPGKAADDGEGVAMIPLRDPASAAAYLKSKTVPVTVNGVPLMKLRSQKQPLYFSLQGDVLVASPGAWPVAAVAKVAQGQSPSIADAPAFAAARAKTLPSANLLVFISPGLAKEIKQGDWIAGSMTIRDTGLELAIDGRTDDKDALKAGGVRPLGRDFLDALPRGAYGFFAMSGLGTYLEAAGKEMEEPAKEMKKAIDVDLHEDVIPALKGNMAYAFYPSLGPDAGIDLLFVVDDANGADPARLAKKLEAAMDEEAEKHKGEMPDGWKTAYAVEGAEASVLAEQPAEEIQKELLGAEKSFFRPLTLSKGKTLAWASVGKSVLIATSTDLLNRAVYTRRNPSASLGLSGDTAFGANPTAAADGQFSLAISMSKLATGIRNTVDPSHMSPEAATTYRKALSLYENTTEPLALRASMDAEGRYHSYFSVPMDWTKLSSLVK